ncbi:hypothetical protein HMPREF9123_2853 [Neisseria bacilliformis ATCC BAA-1200]|uniref:Uncharacterized protein n=1 Tax=Neisseria bacilliformis ATCC BAA-1200 TaxID=888742 RepID=F2BGJ6_9NEIS|nr:hypothetical protein HMPREF9123_2853 [Neisseria bacilliformis ATCC BAA-1200]
MQPKPVFRQPRHSPSAPNVRPRAWLRHTPYLSGGGRLKTEIPFWLRRSCAFRRPLPRGFIWRRL